LDLELAKERRGEANFRLKKSKWIPLIEEVLESGLDNGKKIEPNKLWYYLGKGNKKFMGRHFLND